MKKKYEFTIVKNNIDNIFFFLFIIFNVFSVFAFLNLFINLFILGIYLILNNKKLVLDNFIKIHFIGLFTILLYSAFCIILFKHNIYYFYVILRLLIFNIILYYILYNSTNIGTKINLLLMLFIFNSIIAIMSFYDFFHINILINYLKFLNILNPASSSLIRNGGLISYIEAGFMSFFVIYFLLKRSLNITKILILILIMLSMLFQARTPILFASILFFLEFIFINSKNISYIVIIIFISSILIFNFYDDIKTNINWISDLFTLMDNKSVNDLSNANSLELLKFYNSNLLEQLFGTGLRNWNSNDLNVLNTDSGYLIILRGMGLIGSFLFFLYIGTFILFLINFFYKYYNKKQFAQILVLFLTFIIYNYKGTSFYGIGVSTMFYTVFYLEYFNTRKAKK